MEGKRRSGVKTEGREAKSQYIILSNLKQHIFGKIKMQGSRGAQLSGRCRGERSEPEAASIYIYIYYKIITTTAVFILDNFCTKGP